MGAEVGSFNDELGVGVGLELDSVAELLFVLFNPVRFKLFVEVVKVFLRVYGLDPLPTGPFEVYAIL